MQAHGEVAQTHVFEQLQWVGNGRHGGKKVLRFVHIHLQHISRMLLGFLNGLAEHLGLRSRETLLAAFEAAGLNVVGRLDTKPTHPRHTGNAP